MALNGRLQEMNLLEILQIVAFSKKTGTLRVESSTATGAILFQRGLVLCAFSTSSRPALLSVAAAPEAAVRTALLEDGIRTALRELVALREGSFEFRLNAELPAEWEGLDKAFLERTEGIDPEGLMLELAKELDDARRDTTQILEASTSAESGDEELEEVAQQRDLTVLLVDDEAPVVRVLREALAESGCEVETAAGKTEALSRIVTLADAGHRLLLVTDVSLPASSENSYEGGLEIVARLKSMDGASPVILMAESVSPRARERARQLGVQKIAIKPALTKLDAEEYESDLRSFADVLKKEIELINDPGAGAGPLSPSEPDLNHDVIFEFLKTMTDRLSSPANGIARMILRVASRYSERCLIFLVRDGRARGLAGVHQGRSMAETVAMIRKLSFELQHHRRFAEVVYSKKAVRLAEPPDVSRESIEPGNSTEVALFPLLNNHEVLAVVWCDNPTTGAALGKLAGLELFLVQAGMALENASLHRRLRSLERPYSVDDQGPLTQELMLDPRRKS
jgi:CheY-like chemotaxis protein